MNAACASGSIGPDSAGRGVPRPVDIDRTINAPAWSQPGDLLIVHRRRIKDLPAHVRYAIRRANKELASLGLEIAFRVPDPDLLVDAYLRGAVMTVIRHAVEYLRGRKSGPHVINEPSPETLASAPWLDPKGRPVSVPIEYYRSGRVLGVR